jgi:sigma-B regulation protein RsbU (phosphoserine phosphatase)
MTMDPKLFYRSLDKLLREIDAGEGDEEWFVWLVKEILSRFGEDLCLQSGRLYREEVHGYRLEHEFNSPPGVSAGLVLRGDYEPLLEVQRKKVKIFKATEQGQRDEVERLLGGTDSVAIRIDSEPRRILAFSLAPGWDRERVLLALNTIRNAINHRLNVVDLVLDLDQARQLHHGLLPAQVPKLEGYSLAARSIPAAALGGDFYDFVVSSDGSLVGLAIGDASGHGLAAALVARDVVTGLRMGADRELKITSLLGRLNRVIARSGSSTRFVSLFYGELETNGNFFYVNAGHPPALILGKRGLRTLSIGGCVLGPLAQATFRRGFAHVDQGDTLVLATDGILERRSGSGGLFGVEGVLGVMARTRGARAQEVLDEIMESARRFGDGRPWGDDTTALVVCRERRDDGDQPGA